MKKTLSALTLAFGLFALTGDEVFAQVKKDEPKKVVVEKKTEPKTAAKAGTIEISEGKDGKFRIGIRDGEGKYLAGSPVGHATAKEAAEVAEELLEVIKTAKIVMPKK